MATRWHRATYQAVADVLFEERMHAEAEGYDASGTIARLTSRFESLFAGDNGLFDRGRFERAVYRDHEDGQS